MTSPTGLQCDDFVVHDRGGGVNRIAFGNSAFDPCQLLCAANAVRRSRMDLERMLIYKAQHPPNHPCELYMYSYMYRVDGRRMAGCLGGSEEGFLRLCHPKSGEKCILVTCTPRHAWRPLPPRASWSNRRTRTAALPSACWPAHIRCTVPSVPKCAALAPDRVGLG